jgi:hypothetical protein
MRSITMTGTIVLSPEDSLQIRNTILNPTAEYLKARDEFFNNLASKMTIHSDGTDTVVEFDDLDLSNLDALIEKEVLNSKPTVLQKNSEYISSPMRVSFVGNQARTEAFLKSMLPCLSFDISNTSYSCVKNDVKAEILGCNLSEAA